VPLDQIETNPYQPRKDFDPDELAALKESLVTHGLLQPLVVRSTGRGYQLVAGERRLRAAREAGWKEVPVRIIDFNDQQLFEAALVENLQRADLNPVEKAQGFQDYMTRYGVTQEELARKMGLDRSTVSNLIRLLELPPDVQDAVRLGQISNGHARALVSLDDPARQSALCKEIIAKGLSVRAVEALVKGTRSAASGGGATGGAGATGGSSARASAPDKTAHVLGIEDELRQKLSAKVEIRLQAPDKGQIVLTFESNDDFERLIEVLRQ
jgi:ParB family chromosome partitioning protein